MDAVTRTARAVLRAPGRAAARLGALVRSAFRTPQRAVLSLSLVVLALMYVTNSDMGGDPHSPRGDGTYRPVLARADGHMMYLMLRSMVLDQDLVFDNDLARFGDPWNQWRTATGRKNIPHPIGPPLVWSPVFVLAHGSSKVANAFGADIASHGYTLFHQRIVFATSVLFAFGAVLLAYIVSRRIIGGRWAPLYAAVATLFGTSLTYYATYMPSYGHAMDAFLCAAFLGWWALTHGQTRIRRFVILGVLLGLVSLIRPQGVTLGVVVALEIAVQIIRARPDTRSRLRWSAAMTARGLVTLAVAAVVFTPQMIAWKLLYGSFFTSPMGPGFLRFDHPEVLAVLFSSRNGWLSTTPIAYAGVIGLLFVPRGARVVALGLFLALALQVWINASVFDWWAGASFGQRRLCSMTLVVIFGLGALLAAANNAVRRVPVSLRHALAVVLLGWFVAWNMAQVSRLRGGKAAGHPVAASCCGRVPALMRRMAYPVYEAMGNPFSLPASAWFAWCHDVDIHRWDRVAGSYVDEIGWDRYLSGAYRGQRLEWNILRPDAARYIIRGLGPTQNDTSARRAFRWMTGPRAEIFVPVHLAEAHRLAVHVAPNAASGDAPVSVAISWNGRRYVERAVGPGWSEIELDVPADDIHVGPNVLAIETAVAPYRAGAGVPAPTSPGLVGAAVGSIMVSFPPAPAR